MPGDLLDLELPTDTPLRRAAGYAARPLLTWMLGLPTFRTLRARIRQQASDGAEEPGLAVAARFAGAALRALDIRGQYQWSDAIPSTGPLIIAANHPHGALDGLLLLDAIGRLRADVRLLANHLLAHVPDLRDLCFFVDPFGGPDAVDRSRRGLRAAHLWLRDGGALIMFPAGEVAHERGADGSVVDPDWHTTVGRLALATGARVVPAYIVGSNSRLFRAAGRLHPSLRTVLLARELLKRRGCPATVYFGAARPLTSSINEVPTAEAATATLRARMESLRGGSPPPPIACATPLERLVQDIDRLPHAALLAEAGDLRVYCAGAAALPHVLDEISRLRELAFRAAGEGTGAARDRDRFDDNYQHLFVWNAATREVVGAYRLARIDDIIRQRGVNGLYTRTLFRYDARLFESLPPAVELGRSFVRVEYQRNPGALLLLWKGICAWIARHPQYRILVGAVSISSRYHDRTREMLMAFLTQNHLDAGRAALVTALDPYREPRASMSGSPVPASVDDAERLVAGIEGDGVGMPVLLRQYLKLNARLLGFNRDAAFNDTLDALMTVDLAEVDPRILRRYFGAAEAKAFLALHSLRVTSAA